MNGFNSFGTSSKKIGANRTPIWISVTGVHMSGGTIDAKALAKYSGKVIPAGKMCFLDKQGGTLTIVESGDTANLAKVNGLLYNDVFVDEAASAASGAVVYAGDIWIDRCPDTIAPAQQALLPQIHFTKEL